MIEAIKAHRPGHKSYLDVGCGTGNYLLSIAPHFESVKGLDLNEGMLAQCSKKKDERGLTHVTLQQGSAF